LSQDLKEKPNSILTEHEKTERPPLSVEEIVTSEYCIPLNDRLRALLKAIGVNLTIRK
jgi:hypothetical protein